MPLSVLCFVACALFGLAGAAHAAAAPKLAGENADVSALTVSGLSSGGYMAVQFHVAHSATVSGAGVLAAGPYYCAGGRLSTAWYNCMTPRSWTPLPTQARLEAATRWLEQAGRIDSTRHLAGAKVWIFSGARDETVLPEVVSALETWYRQFVTPTNVAFVSNLPAGHAMPSADPEIKGECSVTAPPYINRCANPGTGAPYDAAGALLAHLMGAAPVAAAAETGALKQFDQREFVAGGPYSISLADAGYVYVPAACATRRCRVHVAFHGCRQSESAVGQAFVRDAGYNRWADAHHLIVLYPQTIARNGFGSGAAFLYNPKGCWDWWGYTGAEYHTKAAPQIKAVKAMVERLAQPR